MNVKNTITSGLFWKILERLAIQLTSFVLSIVIVRIVAPDAYGIISIISVLIDISTVFINGGLGTALIQDENVNNEDFSSSFLFNLLLSILIYLFLFIASPFVASFYDNNSITNVLRVYALAVPLTCLYQIEIVYANKKLYFKNCFESSFVGVLLSGLISVYMAIKGSGVWALVAQYPLNILFTSIVLVFKNKFIPHIFGCKLFSKKLFKFGVEISGADLISTIFNSLNSLIIGKRYSTETLAYYDKGKYIPYLFDNNIAVSIQSVYYPVISLEKDNDQKIISIVKETIAIETYIMAPIYLGLISVAKNMVAVLLTDKWIDCVPYVILFSIAGLFATIGPIDLDILKAKGKSSSILKMELIKKPLWLLLTAVALKFNVYALALVSVIIVPIETLINSIEVKKVINISFIDKLTIWFQSILPAIPMFLITMLLNNLKINSLILLILQVITGLMVFILFSIVTHNKYFEQAKSIIKEKIL